MPSVSNKIQALKDFSEQGFPEQGFPKYKVLKVTVSPAGLG